jgi:PKHD-type hydroxylase
MLIVIEGVLDKVTVAGARLSLDNADWQDGAASAGTLARSQKFNQQLAESDRVGVAIGEEILRRLGAHPLFISAALPNKIYPPRFNRYADGGSYGAHVDSALMRTPRGNITVRSDLSATLFLSEPDEYEGGELEIEGVFGMQAIKLEAGDLILYPSSSLHRVTPVTRGARVASFFWIESFVGDETERTLLFDLDQAIQGMTPLTQPGDKNLLNLTGVYHNLLRRWAAP